MYFVICSHGNWNSYRLTTISQNAYIIHTNPSMCMLVVFFARNKLLLLCTNSLLFNWLTSFSCFCINTHDIINAVVIWLSRNVETQKEPCIHYQIEICSKYLLVIFQILRNLLLFFKLSLSNRIYLIKFKSGFSFWHKIKHFVLTRI